MSQETGDDEDIGRFRPGMAVVPESPQAVVAAINYYLARPLLRATIAARGAQLFRQVTEAEILAPQVAKLVAERGCQSAAPK